VLFPRVVATAGPMLLWNPALLHLEAGQATNFLNLLPVVRVVTTAALLGELPAAV
jgi:drug/metabolite transporter (DMT)-like permease